MNKKSIIATLVAFSAIGVASAEAPLQVEGSVSANAGSGDFAPYFMMANRGGTLTQPKAVELRVKALKDFDLSERFSYGFGADLVGGYQSKYTQYDQAVNTPAVQGHHPNAIWLQQLYGEVKYRGVYLSVGMKERTSPLMNDSLGVGDYTQSNNARPLPQVRAGFVDFQNIPFTNGWVQIQGEIAYGYYMQDDWFEDHFNYYNGFINTGEYYNYKRCYFRTKPSKPFSVTVGMQMVTEFGGTATSYSYDSGEGLTRPLTCSIGEYRSFCLCSSIICSNFTISSLTASSYGHKILLHNCISINIAPCRIVALKLRPEIRKDKTSHTV